MTEFLPEPVRSYVLAAAEALGCHPAYVGVPMLPALASAIGNTRRIRLKASWSEPAVVWTAIVGESGTVKSSALDLATHPVWRRQAKLLKSHVAERAAFEAELQEWKGTPKNERGDRPQPPEACEHVICSDITVEALADRLLATPRGSLVALDELAGWFGSFNAYKSHGSDVSHWLSMHGGRALKVDRKTGEKTTIYVPHAAVSICGTIQPATLRRALLPEFFENGLSARLLPVEPPPRPKRWTDHEIPEDLACAINGLFDKPYALRASSGPDGDEPLMVDLDDGAREAWIAFVNEHGKTMDSYSGHARALYSRLEGYAARFALIVHCVREAVGDKTSAYVDVSDIEAGIGLARWFGAEALRAYRASNETDVERNRRELLDLIYRLGGRVTPRQLKEHCQRFPTSEVAEKALNALVDSADGSWDDTRGQGRGRPPARVFLLADSPDRPLGVFRIPENRNSRANSHFPEPERSRNGEIA